MSAFMKTSPLSSSSSYGMYGATNVNPYASYFGQQPLPGSSSSQGTGTGVGGYYSAQSPQSNSYMSPTSSLTFNPHSFGAATSPFASPGQQLGGGGGGQHFVPLPAQTRIIGGVHTAGASSTSFQQSPPRYSGNSNYNQSSPSGRSEEFAQEPMHYSPIHISPNQQGHAIGIQNNSPANSIVLPSYLLGLDQQTHYHHSFHQSSGVSPPSPGGIVNQSSSSGIIGPSSFMNPVGGYRKTTFLEPSAYGDSENDGAGGDGRGGNKVKGPPIHGFGSSEGSTSKDFMDSPWMKDSYSVSSPCGAATSSQSPHPMLQPPSNPPTATGTWVTVFGFPAGASSFILTNFSTFGKIMEVKATHGSNWLHIRYNNKIEARCALSKNGKVLGGSIMVGVVNSDPKVVQEAQSAGAETSIAGDSQSVTSPSSSILRDRNTGVDCDIKSRIRPLATGSIPHQSMVSKTNPRSLSQMPSLARESIEVERNTSGSGLLPSASNGMFTKAMEFMFGW